MIYASYMFRGNFVYGGYDGMSQSVVISLLSDLGATDIQFIDEATYQAAIQAQQAQI